MQERHPIDDQFRKVLANAEAIPPPSVWAGIAAAQEKRRRAAGWRWYTLAGSVLLVGLTVGTIVYLGSNGPDQEGEVEQQAPALPSTSTPPMERVVPEVASEALPNSGPSTSKAPTSGSQVQQPSLTDADVPASNTITRASTKSPERTTQAHRAVQYSAKDTPPLSAMAPKVALAQLAPSASPVYPTSGPTTDGGVYASGTAREDMEMTGRVRLERLAPVLNVARNEAAPHGAPQQRYHVPHGEWWLGATVGNTQSRTRWQGADEDLATALEQGEGSLGQFVWGLAAGRQWRSGFGISTGVMTDRTERLFRHVALEQTTTVREESYYVTLNNQVFLSDVDTVITTTTTETVTQGVDRRSTLRIPVLGHWRTEWRRWALGARTGLALELTRTEAGPALTRQADGKVGAAMLTGAQRAERYPATVLGVVGLDLAYRLHERWSLEAGYVAMPGAMSLSKRGPVQALTTRHGAELRLIIHLPTRP